MTDVTDVKCTLFGICTSEELYAQVAQAWKERFAARTAFLVKAKADADALTVVEGILNGIEAEKMAGLGMNTCVLACFFDLTRTVSETQLHETSRIARRLEVALGCNVATTLQFGYVGRAALSDGKTIPQNIKAAVAQNERDTKRTQLILVASPTLTTTEAAIWRRPMLLLDILRRSVTPTALLPETPDGKTNNDVGFLDYGEYNDGDYKSLQAQIEALELTTGNQGADRFERRLQAYLSEKEEKLRASYAVNAGMQPQHPDMLVPEGGFPNKRKKAEKGSYEPYNTAQTLTANAVFQTGETLHKAVVDCLALSEQETDTLLKSLIDESKLGLGLADDKCRVKQLLTYPGRDESRPAAPVLAYTDEGAVKEIDRYLSTVMTYAIYCARKALYAKLLAAYEKIPDTYFQKELEREKDKLLDVRSRIKEMYTATEFYQRAVFGHLNLRGELSTADPSAISRSYLTVCGEEFKKLAEEIEGGEVHNVESYYVDPAIGGIQAQDNAPFKILRLTLLDCSDNSLSSLFPEV